MHVRSTKGTHLGGLASSANSLTPHLAPVPAVAAAAVTNTTTTTTKNLSFSSSRELDDHGYRLPAAVAASEAKAEQL
uniref:Uncharacterized protein n=1 Tax=Oryza brachyantha TaxID=4533 RepID=J3KU31_ORYBR